MTCQAILHGEHKAVGIEPTPKVAVWLVSLCSCGEPKLPAALSPVIAVSRSPEGSVAIVIPFSDLSLRAEGVAISVESRDEIASGLAPLATTVEEAECH